MNTEQAIKAHVDAFVRDLTAMIRESALETVRTALGEAVTKKRGPGRPRGSRNATTKTTTRRRKGKRIRRSTEDVEALASAVLDHVKANDGQGVTEIAGALNVTSKDLKLPIVKLLAEKRLRTTGQKRGTKYHAGGRGPARKKAAKRKATRQKATRKKKVAKRGAKKGRVSKKRAKRS